MIRRMKLKVAITDIKVYYWVVFLPHWDKSVFFGTAGWHCRERKWNSSSPCCELMGGRVQKHRTKGGVLIRLIPP